MSVFQTPQPPTSPPSEHDFREGRGWDVDKKSNEKEDLSVKQISRSQ